MKILVTGGAGFIGSHFVRTMLTGGYPAVRGRRGRRPRQAHLRGQPREPRTGRGLAAADVRPGRHPATRELVGDLMAGVDAVVHFAAESHVDRSITGAADFVRDQRRRHADAAARRRCGRGVGRFVHVSTDEVYGSIAEGSWPETHPLEPNSPYSASKAGSDLLARGLPPHPRHGRRHHPLLEQLRAVPVPGEGHPAVRHEPHRRQERAAVRRRARTCATGCTSTTTAAASRSCSPAGARARSTTSAAAPS